MVFLQAPILNLGKSIHGTTHPLPLYKVQSIHRTPYPNKRHNFGRQRLKRELGIRDNRTVLERDVLAVLDILKITYLNLVSFHRLCVDFLLARFLPEQKPVGVNPVFQRNGTDYTFSSSKTTSHRSDSSS
jgi:hypothetical protein